MTVKPSILHSGEVLHRHSFQAQIEDVIEVEANRLVHRSSARLLHLLEDQRIDPKLILRALQVILQIFVEAKSVWTRFIGFRCAEHPLFGRLVHISRIGPLIVIVFSLLFLLDLFELLVSSHA